MAPGLEHSQKMSRCGLGGALEKKGQEGEWRFRLFSGLFRHLPDARDHLAALCFLGSLSSVCSHLLEHCLNITRWLLQLQTSRV